jgi:hypothetical protein
MITRLFTVFGIVALVAALRLTAFAAPATVTLGQLGIKGDVTGYGSRPALSFYLPVYRSVRAVRFRAALKLSPALDRNSMLTFTSGGTPIWTVSVDYLRKHPNVDIALPLPEPPQHVVDVNITGTLAHVGDDVCSRFDPSSLYVIVTRGSGFVVDAQPDASTISGFLEAYEGDVTIVVPPGSDITRKRIAVRLAYEVQQLYRWRRASVVLRSTPDRSSRNIILGDFTTDLEARGSELRVGPKGYALLDREIDPLLITTAVDASQIEPESTPPPGPHLFLRDLGMTTQTLSGAHNVFSIPFTIGKADGMPKGLRFSAVIAHTALGPTERGTIDLLANGALVDSVPLSAQRGRQDVEFAISPNAIGASNDVSVVVDYDVARDCHVAPPALTTTLYDDSNFRWDGTTPYAFSVGDFFRAASGHVAVMIDDDTLIPYAFSLLSTLGSGNTNITSLDVIPVQDTLPKGYDAAIVVAPLDRLPHWELPLTQDGNRFVLGHGAPPLVAAYHDPFGVLESVRIGNTPVLVASYWKDATATSDVDAIGYATLGSQTDRVFMFRGSTTLYASTAPMRREVSQPVLLRAAIPIYAGCFSLLGVVVLVARRKRQGGKAA